MTIKSQADSTGPFIPILLVEDNPADVSLLRESLEEHAVDCELSVVTDGEAAIELIHTISAGKHNRPALVILDLNLPKRSGLDVLESLRSSPGLENVPVLILSSSDAHNDRKEAARLGATNYLRKPLNLDDFMKIGAIVKLALSGEPI